MSQETFYLDSGLESDGWDVNPDFPVQLSLPNWGIRTREQSPITPPPSARARSPPPIGVDDHAQLQESYNQLLTEHRSRPRFFTPPPTLYEGELSSLDEDFDADHDHEGPREELHPAPVPDTLSNVIGYEHIFTFVPGTMGAIAIDQGVALDALEQAGSFQGAVLSLVEIIGNMLDWPEEHHQDLIDPISDAMSDMLEAVVQNPDFLKPVNVRLSKEMFEELITRKIMSKKLKKVLPNDDYCCVICMEDVRPKQHCSILGCKHFFHLNCAREWFSKQCNKPTCPCCRKDAREMETFETVLNIEKAQKIKKRLKKIRRSSRIFEKQLAMLNLKLAGN